MHALRFRLFSTPYRRDLAATTLVVLLGGVWLVIKSGDGIFIRDGLRPALGMYALFVAGPLPGWILGVHFGALGPGQLYPGLVMMLLWTLFNLWPFVRAARVAKPVSRRLWLAFGGVFWLFTSYLFIVAVQA